MLNSSKGKKNLSLLAWQTGHLRAPLAHGPIAPLLAQPSEPSPPPALSAACYPSVQLSGRLLGFLL